MSADARRCLTIVLAAGEGVRMRSARPKVLHEIAGRSMLGHALSAVGEAGTQDIVVVIGPGRGDVAAEALRVAPGAKSRFRASEGAPRTPFSPPARRSRAATTTF